MDIFLTRLVLLNTPPPPPPLPHQHSASPLSGGLTCGLLTVAQFLVLLRNVSIPLLMMIIIMMMLMMMMMVMIMMKRMRMIIIIN